MSARVDKEAMACNKPRRTPSHPTKSHVVKACYDGKQKVIRFGEQGASTAGKPKTGESQRMKTKRASFKARHAKNIAKGPSSPAYWANKVKWADGGSVELKNYPDPFADLSAMRKLAEMVKGIGVGAKYLAKESKAVGSHLNATDQYAELLRKRYPELGQRRVDRGPLDAAINYSGAYDWAARPEVAPEDARSMAFRYQLKDYVNPTRIGSNEAADYAQNMAGVEQALLDRQAGTVRKREDIAELARKYAAAEAAAGRVPKFAEGGDMRVASELGEQYQRAFSSARRAGSSFLGALPEAARTSVQSTVDLAQLVGKYLMASPADRAVMTARVPELAQAAYQALKEELPQLPQRVAQATPEQVGRFGAQFTTDTLLDPMRLGRLGSVPKTLGVVKPKGGNWAQKAERRLIAELEPRGPTNRDEALAFGGAWNRLVDEPQGQRVIKQDAAINDWLKTKLARYIKNEMGTAEDPLIALAERGVLHYEPWTEAVRAHANRKMAGMPIDPQSSSPLAQAWENASDAAINAPTRYQDMVPFAAPSYAASLEDLGGKYAVENPEALAYSLNTGTRAGDLGFTHLVDELRNAIRPDSGLPAQLRLKPEDLSKVSMPQAVQLVDKINKWRAKQKAEADRLLANNPATFVHKDYPEGYQWVELRQSDKPNLEADSALADALKYEGEMMGHCVDRYCSDVQSGNSRIYSLRNKKTGEPHVTIEVVQKLDQNITEDPLELVESIRNAIPTNQSTEFERWLDKNAEDFDIDSLRGTKWFKYAPTVGTYEISQIRGKGNRKPIDKYIPFVQDFVKSGNWEDVSELHNADLIPVHPNSELGSAMLGQGVQPPRYVTDQELTELLGKYGRTTYATGGAVRVYNPDLIQRMSNQLFEAHHG